VPYKIKSVHLLVKKVIITKMHGATHIKVIKGYIDKESAKPVILIFKIYISICLLVKRKIQTEPEVIFWTSSIQLCTIKYKYVEGKTIPLENCIGLGESRSLRLPRLSDNRHMNVARLSALHTGRLYPQAKPQVHLY
jgi:hypothetical protein